MNVLHPHIDFQIRPVTHAPPSLGFGFALPQPASPAMFSSGWQPTVPPASPFVHINTSGPQQSPSRVQKRRHEPDDSQADEAMDRSPTPDRPKRAPPKRLRQHEPTKVPETSKENKAPSEDNDVDIGVLLASLPTQSLLPLLTSLITAQPSLKTAVLPLIPRPTIQIALQAIAESAKKLRDAYPYSHSMQPTSSSSSIGFGFGSASRVSAFGQSNNFGKSGFAENQSNSTNAGMRDEYIVSRIRPHITEFVSAVVSYLPYFSFMPSVESSNVAGQQSTTLRGLHRGKSNPMETFAYLEAVTSHLLNQPPLAVSSLAPQLLPRLLDEWKAWVAKVDTVVNQEGGMFGNETASGWVRSLDQFAECKDAQCASALRSVRDVWVRKVGWLVGRSVQHQMDL